MWLLPGLGKPETLDFLGFTHICGRTRERAVPAEAHHDLEADAGSSLPRSETRSSNVGTSPSPNRAGGWARWCEAISPSSAPCPATVRPSELSELRRPGWCKALRRGSQRQCLHWADEPRNGPMSTRPRPPCLSRGARCRQGPEAVAQCGSSARWGLCGSRPRGRSLP